MVAKGRQGAKIKKVDVIAIRAATGASQRKLAAQYGISQSQISNIRSGKNWSHLDQEQDPDRTGKGWDVQALPMSGER
jgi:hypothetical protein